MSSSAVKMMIPFSRLTSIVVMLVLAYACDARNPAAPAPASAPRRLDGAADGDAQLGSLDLGPETPFSVVAEIPESKWALVRVSGAWSVRPNPACASQPPNWPCSTSPAYSGFAPGYPDGFAGPVRVATFHDGSWDDVALRAFGGPEDGIGLTQREFARMLFAGPALQNPTVQEFGNTGPLIRSYLIDGTYSVTVTAIQSPIRVTEGAPEADGNRTYTVEPLYGLQLINPLGSSAPPGAIRWYFVPGDSVSPVATSSDPPWSLPACADQPTCRWQPPGPGRVQVAAYVETRRARARSDGGPPKPVGMLALACKPDSLIVGNITTCKASLTPTTSTLTVQTWRFDGDSLGVAFGLTADVKTWVFRPSVCGAVSVTASVDGVTQTATTRVEVVCNMLTGVSHDSLLNDIAVQRAMHQYWAASNPTDPSVGNRKEQGGYIVRDTATKVLSVVPFSSNSAPDVCFATLEGTDLTQSFQNGQTLVGMFHTHPHNPGQPPPATCHVKNSGLPGAHFGDGASDVDYVAVNDSSWSVPSYIVDFRHVHRIRPGDTPGSPLHTERRSNNCS